MGNEVFIKKKSKQKVTLQEWNKFLKENDKFEKREFFQTANPSTGEIQKISAPNSAVWRDTNKKVTFLFNKDKGEISVSNPDKGVINKMLEIASYFDAEVIGNKGEKYNKTARKWWKFWQYQPILIEDTLNFFSFRSFIIA